MYFFTTAALLMRPLLSIVVIVSNFNNRTFILNMRFDLFELFCQEKSWKIGDINQSESFKNNNHSNHSNLDFKKTPSQFLKDSRIDH